MGFGSAGGFWRRGNSPFVPPVNPNTDSYLKLETHRLGTMLQERYTGNTVARTRLTALNQPVGTIYDMGYNAHVLSTDEPLLPDVTSFDTLNACIGFLSGTDPIVYDNLDRSSFKFFQGDNKVWSIQFKIGLPNGTDGSNRTVITTNNVGNSLSYGIIVRRGTGNTMQVFVQKGVSGTSLLAHTHSTIVNEAVGVASVQININGSGVGAGMMRVNGVEEIFDVGSGVSNNSTAPLVIGGSNTTTNSNIYVADLDIKNRILTSQELTDFEIYFPSFDTSDFAPIPQWNIDLQDTSKIWADTGKTTPITDGAAVRVIESNHNFLGGFIRELKSAAAGSSPVFESAFQNSKNVITFDGTDDNLVFSNRLIYENGGIYTMFIAAKNEDSTDGSHLLAGDDGDYLVLTGQDYSGAFEDPYFAYHTSSDVGSVIGTSVINSVEVFAIKRNGTTYTVYNGNGASFTVNSSAGFFTGERMGLSGASIGADWNFDGFLCSLEKYNGLISDEQIQARLIELKAVFG